MVTEQTEIDLQGTVALLLKDRIKCCFSLAAVWHNLAGHLRRSGSVQTNVQVNYPKAEMFLLNQLNSD